MVQPSEFISLLHEFLDVVCFSMSPLKTTEDFESSLLGLNHRIEVRQFPQLDDFRGHIVGPSTAWFRLFLFPAIRRHRKWFSIANLRDHIHSISGRCSIDSFRNDVLLCLRSLPPVNQHRRSERNEWPAHRCWVQGASIEILNCQSEHLLEFFFSGLLSTRDNFFVNFLNTRVFRENIFANTSLIRKSASASSCGMKHELS